MLDAVIPTRKLVRCFVAVVVLAQPLFLAGWAFPSQSKNTSPAKAQKTDSHRQIDRLEDKWRDATLKGDAATLDSLLGDDYVAIMANGTLQTKDQTLANIRSGKLHFTLLDFSERKIRIYGRTALVTSLVQVEGTGPDGSLTGTYRYSRVYAKDPRGAWKIVNFEASRIGHGPHPGSAGKTN